MNRQTLIVAQDGTGDFSRVQDAVDSITPSTGACRDIRIRPGIYRDSVLVPADKTRVRLLGEDAATTILTGDRTARQIGADGVELGMYRTATVQVLADDFAAEGVTFENTAGEGGQALALSIRGDRARFRRCRFLGWQDTLYVERGRHYFADCQIAGHCDYIFGGATAVFEQCAIHSLSANYVTAASTPIESEHGLVFLRCRFTDDGRSKAYYLGRPWRPHAAVAVVECELSGNINPAGWHNWNKPDAERTARFCEYGCIGAGAGVSARVRWSRQLTDDEAARLRPSLILGGADGWNPHDWP